ncbi:MAG: hypothetical protein IJR07_08660 [Bacteroidaceae bacterium]|nr:hypothetical protein [Bacteroidaceae bacterium]
MGLFNWKDSYENKKEEIKEVEEPTTSWWWLGGLILLFEVYSVYSACLTTDD